MRTLLIALLLLAACGSDEPSLSEAFCQDLRNGYTVMNLWDREQDPAEYADRVYGRVAISCPEQFETNEGLRAYLEDWNINPEPVD